MPRPFVVTPALHSAGATVLHRSPFDDLAVPVSTVPMATALRDHWVKPFYMAFPYRLDGVADLVRAQFDEIDAELITALLAEFNWRPRIVGAFFLALEPRPDFEEQLGRLLLRSDVCYAGAGYCLALARLGTAGALSFLQRYLRYYLTRADLYFDQASALAAVRHLDEANSTDHAREFDEDWAEFTRDKPGWDLEETCVRFDAAMHGLRSLRGSCSPRPEPTAG